MPTNKYTNANLAAGNKERAGAVAPGRLLRLQGTYEKTAADNDGSVLRLGRVPANAIPLYQNSFLNNDALTGATNVDVGLYKPGVAGAAVDKDLLTAGISIASAAALASPIRAFQTRPTIEDWGRSLKELVELVNSITTFDEEYDIAITGNTFGTAVGTISWDLTFLVPQQ